MIKARQIQEERFAPMVDVTAMPNDISLIWLFCVLDELVRPY